MSLKGKDLLCTQDWTREELIEILELAEDMQKERFSYKYSEVLKNKTFFMFFYNPSVRTRQSFECAATELGGHAQYLAPEGMRLKTAKSAGETVEDAAKVMSRYACGIGIRILEDKVTYYGEGHELLQEYAKWADIPVVSMAHDKFHPCQGLADVMGMRKHLGKDLRKKKLLQIWGHGALARSWSSVQESILISSRFGMDVTLAYPEGFDLDPAVIEATKKNCEEADGKFEISHDPYACYDEVDVVYSRHWMSPRAYQNGEFLKSKEIELALKYPEWICDTQKMKRSNNALFSHPMPVDRGHEVTDDVASGNRSIIYDVAENRLHVQKAIMALTMI
ncbi:MAG TPA: ornithine carbamoyltransferase [Candidatus Eremiobacteraeota bacterium]|nr:MAG: N-acetylornithine carbamoyltransferase [bacterium ADurb.Bin363]HPZ07122.1 ornithine carbamoyltransferase [Candidatus Eremiobacteraeota bacterium]